MPQKRYLVVLLGGLLTISQVGLAASFSDSLTGTTLNQNYTLNYGTTNPVYNNGVGYTTDFTSQGIILSRSANSENGSVEIDSNFTFRGNYQVTVVVSGLATGLTDLAQAGLIVKDNYEPDIPNHLSDIFSTGNSNIGTVNWLNASSMSNTTIGVNRDLLTITGNTNGYSYTLGIFLIQQMGGTAANSVTFRDLNLTADTISGVSAAPIPSALWLVGSGLAGLIGFNRGKLA